MSKANWVVQSYSAEGNLSMECLRCKGEVELVLPAQMLSVIACLEGFYNSHKKCDREES